MSIKASSQIPSSIVSNGTIISSTSSLNFAPRNCATMPAGHRFFRLDPHDSSSPKYRAVIAACFSFLVSIFYPSAVTLPLFVPKEFS